MYTLPVHPDTAHHSCTEIQHPDHSRLSLHVYKQISAIEMHAQCERRGIWSNTEAMSCKILAIIL